MNESGNEGTLWTEYTGGPTGHMSYVHGNDIVNIMTNIVPLASQHVFDMLCLFNPQGSSSYMVDCIAMD